MNPEPSSSRIAPKSSKASQQSVERDNDTRDAVEPASESTPTLRSTAAPQASDEPFVRKLRLNLSLVNSGSVARDHLASERTFLAYVRTSLAITSMGVALVQLFKLSLSTSLAHRYARPLGALIVVIGLLVLALGFVRYFSTQHALMQGKFPAARATVTALAFVLGAVTCVVFGIIVGVASAS